MRQLGVLVWFDLARFGFCGWAMAAAAWCLPPAGAAFLYCLSADAMAGRAAWRRHFGVEGEAAGRRAPRGECGWARVRAVWLARGSRPALSTQRRLGAFFARRLLVVPWPVGVLAGCWVRCLCATLKDRATCGLAVAARLSVGGGAARLYAYVFIATIRL